MPIRSAPTSAKSVRNVASRLPVLRLKRLVYYIRVTFINEYAARSIGEETIVTLL